MTLPLLISANSKRKLEQIPLTNLDYKSNMLRIYGKKLDWSGLNKMLLIFTCCDDPEFDELAPKLLEQGVNYFRVNSERLMNYKFSLAIKDGQLQGTISDQYETLDLSSVNAVWFRHFSLSSVLWPTDFDNITKQYAYEQWETFFETLNHLDTWIISGFSWNKKLTKPFQLTIASKVGFKIPKTLVTNSDQRLSLLGSKEIFAKALRNHSIEVKPDILKKIYGISLKSANDLTLNELSPSPTIIQDYQDHNEIKEIRVTVFGDYYLADQYNNVESADWHDQGINGINLSAYTLPEKINDQIRQFMSLAHLSVGTIDLFLLKGDWYFLEVNTAGDWRWIEQYENQPFANDCCAFIKKGISKTSSKI